MQARLREPNRTREQKPNPDDPTKTEEKAPGEPLSTILELIFVHRQQTHISWPFIYCMHRTYTSPCKQEADCVL